MVKNVFSQFPQMFGKKLQDCHLRLSLGNTEHTLISTVLTISQGDKKLHRKTNISCSSV